MDDRRFAALRLRSPRSDGTARAAWQPMRFASYDAVRLRRMPPADPPLCKFRRRSCPIHSLPQEAVHRRKRLRSATRRAAETVHALKAVSSLIEVLLRELPIVFVGISGGREVCHPLGPPGTQKARPSFASSSPNFLAHGKPTA